MIHPISCTSYNFQKLTDTRKLYPLSPASYVLHRERGGVLATWWNLRDRISSGAVKRLDFPLVENLLLTMLVESIF